MISSLERQFQLTELEREERAILYLIADGLAEGREVRLAELASSGICSSASVYRHVRMLVAKNVIQLHGDAPKTVSLARRLGGFENAFMNAFAQLEEPPKGNGL